ncbi:hypothetical protein [Cellulophaga baltica]|uniref:hypothetical protein n=1 Tax=Cellulophaga baltica TaxID=76594 RepID=UPI00040BD97C|nr:hypothetical protein [Cellulophaga baltica]AIY12561.1 hypothetical protein M667_04725 [Cellulophaga baltica NN016038]
MRVSKLLTELKISYKRLTRYNKFLETPITNLNQELDENTHLQIIALHNNKEIQDQLDGIAINEQVEAYNGYLGKDSCKFIGKIKWYYNKANNGEYGFAEHNKLGDIHFRGNVVKGIDPHELRENETVIFSITKKNFVDRERIKATALYKIDFEKDLPFLMYLGVTKEQAKFLEQALTIINKEDFKLETNKKLEIENVFNTYFKASKLNINQVSGILNIAPKLKIDVSEQQFEIIYKYFDAKQKFQLFIDTNYLLPFQEIEATLVDYIYNNPLNSTSVLNKLDTSDINIVLQQLFNKVILNPEKDNFHAILKLLKKHNYNIDYSKLSPKKITDLWFRDSFETFPIDAVYKYLCELKAQLDKAYDQDNIISIREEIYRVFNKTSREEHINLFSKTHYQQDQIKEVEVFNLVKFYLNYTEDEVLKQSFIDTINSKASDFIKLHLFLSNYTNTIDYNNVVIYTGILSSYNQKRFFKKVLMLIETKVLTLTLNDLNKITTYNYLDNEYAKEIDGVGLDFTLSIILKIASDLSNNEITSRNTIFDIIANQIKSPQDLLVIKGFFQKCDGRTTTKEFTVKKEGETEPSYYKNKTDKKPRFAHFCDGRKAVNSNSGEPILSRKENLEFWWCENVPCFETCRKPVDSNNWRNYSLQDVLRILNINYSEKQYEIVLAVINRVNRFLEHLKCKSCSNILRPNGRANYGFYGVSMFSCTNHDCENPDKDVYLSHCLNGQCEDLIDSRETVKCRPSALENPDNCGWYICNNCYACCDSEKLNARKSRIESVGQNYLCHTEGHRNLGIICCTECGTETNRNIFNSELYIRQLEWFKSMVDTESIVNSNQRQDGKWWFRWYRGSLTFEKFHNALLSLKANGFQVPNLERGDDIQFVAEPLSDNYVFKCTNCDYVIDLSDTDIFNYARRKAIENFHTTIYPNTHTQ